MKRFTRLDGDGYFVIDDDTVFEDQSENFCGPSVDRLAAYEDTGLMPEEIPKWVPVSERLPEFTDTYICYCNIGSMGGGYKEVRAYRLECVKGKEPKWCIPNGWDEVVSVTHWQELPHPPKEEK